MNACMIAVAFAYVDQNLIDAAADDPHLTGTDRSGGHKSTLDLSWNCMRDTMVPFAAALRCEVVDITAQRG